MFLDKYSDIVTEEESFQESRENKALAAIRKNKLKAGEGFEDRLIPSFSNIDQSNWNPKVYRLPETEKPGKSKMHWTGEYYVQEESAALPVAVLDPNPGEMILDMCAAPGGKATQIADRIQNQGTVVANDVSSKRMKSLHSNVYRTGASSVATTNYDGRNFPGTEVLDRILVDAPCSGEGDRLRRGRGPVDEEASRDLAEMQFRIMERAAGLVKKSGTVVYSTCTISPIENESVVSKVVEETGLDLVEIETDASHQKGETEFENEDYGEEMRKTVRVLPHHMKSGVIYVAKFEK